MVSVRQTAKQTAKQTISKFSNLMSADAKPHSEEEPEPKPKPIKGSLEHVVVSVQNVRVKAKNFGEMYGNIIDRVVVEGHIQEMAAIEHVGGDVKRGVVLSAQIHQRVETDLPALAAQGVQTQKQLQGFDKRLVHFTSELQAEMRNLPAKVAALVTQKSVSELVNSEGIAILAMNMFNEYLKAHEAKQGEKTL